MAATIGRRPSRPIVFPHARSRLKLSRQRRPRSERACHRRRRRAPDLHAMVRPHFGSGRRLRRHRAASAGDHLVTALQNRWEAATLHWACQFAGIVVTPVNWRATASEIDFYLDDADAKAVAYEDASAAAVAGSVAARNLPRIALDAAPPPAIAFGSLVADSAPDASPRGHARNLVGDALHVRHHGAAQGRAAPPARRARRRRGSRRAKSLRARRAHARRHAALSHHGRALALGDVAYRRRLRLPAPVRRRASAAT